MKNLTIKIIAGLAYIAMVAVNFMANSLPINNRSTGEISEAYPNLFAPAGLTFAIWGVIYLLLAGFVVYLFLNKEKRNEELFSKINPLFIVTSVANISWIFAWHYDYIGLSVLIMAVLLVSLIKIADILRKQQFTSIDKLLIWAPFSIYFGWITVATIANVTVFLVSIGWDGFGIAEDVWTVLILLVGALIGILRMLNDKNVAYGLVFIWAYFGILLKHMSDDGFDLQYPFIIITVIVCLYFFAYFVSKIFHSKRSEKRSNVIV